MRNENRNEFWGEKKGRDKGEEGSEKFVKMEY